MRKDEYESMKRAKYRCSKANRKQGGSCEHPCSPSKHGKTVYIYTNIPDCLTYCQRTVGVEKMEGLP